MNSANGSALLTVFSLLIGIPVICAWLGLLVQCANAEFKTGGDKVSWTLIVIFLGPLGALLYLLGGRVRHPKSNPKEKWVV